MFEISLARRIRADKEFIFDWWTDLSPDDVKLAKPLKKRQIISKTPNLIVLHDEEQMYFRRMSFDIKVTLNRPDSWISEYDGSNASARSEYSLKSENDGSTTLKYHSRVEPKGMLTRNFSFIVKP